MARPLILGYGIAQNRDDDDDDDDDGGGGGGYPCGTGRGRGGDLRDSDPFAAIDREQTASAVEGGQAALSRPAGPADRTPDDLVEEAQVAIVDIAGDTSASLSRPPRPRPGELRLAAAGSGRPLAPPGAAVAHPQAMFTGLVAAIGQVTARQGAGGAPRRLTIAVPAELAAAGLGASVAIDGCCLTVVAAAGGRLAFEATTETLRRTTLGALEVGARVNLEPALRVGDPLGGHWVAGHVDGLGKLLAAEREDSAVYLRIAAPPEVLCLCAPRGSVTVAGVSLTVTDVDTATFQVAIIPHTLRATTLGATEVGSPLNLEADLMARYAARLLATRGAPVPPQATVVRPLADDVVSPGA